MKHGILLLTFLLIGCSLESNNANLESLGLSAGTLEPAFSADKTDYTLSISTGSLSITPTTENNATDVLVKFNDGNYTLISSGETVTYAPELGENTLRIKIVAEDGGANKTYKIVVSRDN